MTKEYFVEATRYQGSGIRILSRGLGMKSRKVVYVDGVEIGEYLNVSKARQAAKFVIHGYRDLAWNFSIEGITAIAKSEKTQ